VHIKFWKENLQDRDHYEDLDVDGIILKLILKKQGREGVD
jgi:hypothetical protein